MQFGRIQKFLPQSMALFQQQEAQGEAGAADFFLDFLVRRGGVFRAALERSCERIRSPTEKQNKKYRPKGPVRDGV